MSRSDTDLLEWLTDREQINRVVYRYLFTIDQFNWGAFADVLTPTFGQQAGEGPIVTYTPEEFGVMMEEKYRPLGNDQLLQHFVTACVATIHGDTAEATAYVRSFHEVRSGIPGAPKSRQAGGRYQFGFARDGSDWKISSHQIFVLWRTGALEPPA